MTCKMLKVKRKKKVGRLGSGGEGNRRQFSVPQLTSVYMDLHLQRCIFAS